MESRTCQDQVSWYLTHPTPPAFDMMIRRFSRSGFAASEPSRKGHAVMARRIHEDEGTRVEALDEPSRRFGPLRVPTGVQRNQVDPIFVAKGPRASPVWLDISLSVRPQRVGRSLKRSRSDNVGCLFSPRIVSVMCLSPERTEQFRRIDRNGCRKSHSAAAARRGGTGRGKNKRHHSFVNSQFVV